LKLLVYGAGVTGSLSARSGLNNAAPAGEVAELEQTAEQMRAYARAR
jgi:hypothetical protein